MEQPEYQVIPCRECGADVDHDGHKPECSRYGPEYKSILPLVGIDGNAFAVMGTVRKGLRRAGAPKEYIDDVMAQMQAGDYDHLLSVAIRYTEEV